MCNKKVWWFLIVLWYIYCYYRYWVTLFIFVHSSDCSHVTQEPYHFAIRIRIGTFNFGNESNWKITAILHKNVVFDNFLEIALDFVYCVNTHSYCVYLYFSVVCSATLSQHIYLFNRFIVYSFGACSTCVTLLWKLDKFWLYSCLTIGPFRTCLSPVKVKRHMN